MILKILLPIVSTILTIITITGSFAFGQSGQPAEREVSFRNGAVELKGTLLIAEAENKIPAVVFLHGSGSHAREGFRPYAEEFAKLGIASLFYDKRGSGSSGGSWITSSLEDLAGDALAAIEFLKNTDEIDPARIGFWGISQAGWVAPMAAARSQEIAFMILISGGGATPLESELFSYEQEFKKAGLSESQKGEAREVLDAYFRYLETGDDRPGLISKLESLKVTWMNPLAVELLQVVPSQANRPNWNWVASYDPVTDIEKLTMPILLLFGDIDTDQPTEVAVKRWREGLSRAGNGEVTVVVYPGAGHGIRMGIDHSRSAPFADGYMEVQIEWLLRNVVK
jgi:uncharacterized protein